MALFFKKKTPATVYEAVKAPVKTDKNPYEAKKEDTAYEAKKPSKGNKNPYKA